MKRKDLLELANLRIKEAKVLLNMNCPEGSYYLAGYAAELALKACIARKTERYEFPDKMRVQSSYTHDLVKLVKVAGLDAELDEATGKDHDLRENWMVVKGSSEQSRYMRPSREEAEVLLDALSNRKHGVYRWLRHYC